MDALHGRATNLRAGAESQQIVATRPLYCLQYPASTKSSAKDQPRAPGIKAL